MIKVTVSNEDGRGFDEDDILHALTEDMAADLRTSSGELTCPAHGPAGFVDVQVVEGGVKVRACCKALFRLLPDL